MLGKDGYLMLADCNKVQLSTTKTHFQFSKPVILEVQFTNSQWFVNVHSMVYITFTTFMGQSMYTNWVSPGHACKQLARTFLMLQPHPYICCQLARTSSPFLPHLPVSNNNLLMEAHFISESFGTLAPSAHMLQYSVHSQRLDDLLKPVPDNTNTKGNILQR